MGNNLHTSILLIQAKRFKHIIRQNSYEKGRKVNMNEVCARAHVCMGVWVALFLKSKKHPLASRSKSVCVCVCVVLHSPGEIEQNEKTKWNSLFNRYTLPPHTHACMHTPCPEPPTPGRWPRFCYPINDPDSMWGSTHTIWATRHWSLDITSLKTSECIFIFTVMQLVQSTVKWKRKLSVNDCMGWSQVFPVSPLQCV